MKFVIGLDVDEVLFRTSAMEQDYYDSRMAEDGYIVKDGMMYKGETCIGESNSLAAVKIWHRYDMLYPPTDAYVDSKYVDQSAVKAVKQCLADHTDWEFVVITSRASLNHVDAEDLSKTQRSKYARVRRGVRDMITQFLPITRFYFTEQKDDCMIHNDIDVLVDDCDTFINAVRSRAGKVGIKRCMNSISCGPQCFYDFAELQPLLEGIYTERMKNSEV